MYRCQECLELYPAGLVYPALVKPAVFKNGVWALLCKDCRKVLKDRIIVKPDNQLVCREVVRELI